MSPAFLMARVVPHKQDAFYTEASQNNGFAVAAGCWTEPCWWNYIVLQPLVKA